MERDEPGGVMFVEWAASPGTCLCFLAGGTQRRTLCLGVAFLWEEVCQVDGETMETVTEFIFLGSKSLQMVTAAMKLNDSCSLKNSYGKPRQHIREQRGYFANKGLSSQSYGFFPVVMYGCESWTIKKAECQRTDDFQLVLEKTLESPLDCKEI